MYLGLYEIHMPKHRNTQHIGLYDYPRSPQAAVVISGKRPTPASLSSRERERSTSLRQRPETVESAPVSHCMCTELARE